MGDRGTKPNSSMVSGLSSRLSSLASSGPLYLVFTGRTPQRGHPSRCTSPRWHCWAAGPAAWSRSPAALAGNSPVYIHGCKSPLPVAEWAAGKPDCKAHGRKPYFRYSSTLHPDQDRRPCTRNPFPQTRDLPPRLGLRHSHRHRLPRPVPRLVGETRQCHVTDNPRSPQERRHQCPQSRSP